MNNKTFLLSSLALLTFAAFAGETVSRATINLIDGSRIVGTVKNESVQISTSFGDLAIPIDKIKSIDFSKSRTAAPAQEELIYHCTFDSAESVRTPEVGPSGTIAEEKVEFAQGKSGQAIRFFKGNRDAVIIDFDTLPPDGCIEFWAKIEDGDGQYEDAGNPVFFRLQEVGGNCAELRISRNNGNGQFGICAYSFGMAGGSRFGATGRYDDLFRDRAGSGWHHYAVNWGKDPSLYLDGERITTLVQRRADDHKTEIGRPYKLYLHFMDGGPNPNPESFLMDDLKIWNRCKGGFLKEK